MSELDFNQKVEMRRAFWAAGASTRVNVRIGALVDRAKSKTRAGSEDWTDLDVLAVEYGPIHGATFSVADCKTIRSRVTERVFWLRGVADLFDARAAYLTRETEIPPSARQLALRLGIAAFDPVDRRAFIEQLGENELPQSGSFLEGSALHRWESLVGATPHAVDRLQRYRQTYYWLQRPRRNLTALPTALTQASPHIVPDHPWALAVVVDLAWLYLVAALGAVDDITKLHLSDVPRALAQSIVGSEQERREKEVLAEQLRALISEIDPTRASRLPAIPLLPAYMDELVDLISRIGRRRGDVLAALRCLEFTGVETIAGSGSPWTAAFPAANLFAPKLASDVVRFLVRAASLSPDFVTLFDEAVAAGRPPTGRARQAYGHGTRATAAPSQTKRAADPKSNVVRPTAPAQVELFDGDDPKRSVSNGEAGPLDEGTRAPANPNGQSTLDDPLQREA